jgi:hypothetical protein
LTIILLAALMAVTSPAIAGQAVLWIHESGDFYVERTIADQAMFSENGRGLFTHLLHLARMAEISRPGEMKCDNGQMYKIEITDPDTLMVDGSPFYQVD